MKFNGDKINISVSKNAIRVFESFEKIRPNNISFSLGIAIAAEEYVKNHSGLNSQITDFTDESVSVGLPMFNAPIYKWKHSLSSLSSKEFKEMQTRLTQLNNIVQDEVLKRISLCQK